MRLGLSLATLGVAVSVAVMALGCALPPRASTGSSRCCSARSPRPTDAAAVFSVLRGVPLPRRLTGALEAESGLNDAPTVVLVTLISTGDVGDHGVLGLGGHHRLRAGRRRRDRARPGLRRRLGDAAGRAAGVRPVPARGAELWPSSPTARRRPSTPRGFAAVYVAALVLGNSELPHRGATRSFAEGVAWLAQIGLFVMLGLLLSPGRIGWERLAGAAGRAGADLVARPISVRRQLGGAAGCPGASWRSCPGPACAARCRSCWRRSRWPRASRAPSGCSTSCS